jgi:hypothetical protein
MKMNRIDSISTIILLIFCLLFSVIGCGSGGGGVSDSNSIQGFIQKGPFIQGSMVSIQELDRNLIPTGKVFLTETFDDAGSFDLEANIDSGYLDIKTTGFYFNEVSGSLSNASITLNAIVDATESKNINVNILTTLTYHRIKYLILNKNINLYEAQEQAEYEVLRIFYIDRNILGTQLDNFYRMDISKEGISNAILLAISCILQSGNTEAELSELLAKISSDIEIDGILNTRAYIDKIMNSSEALQPDFIRQNLINRYKSLGTAITVPDFENFIDFDSDGIIALYETKDPIFELEGGVYDHDISVTLLSAINNATIFFTTDGSEPTYSSNIYSGPILISGDGTVITIKAFAAKEGLDDSNVVSATYTIDFLRIYSPFFDLYAGTYNEDISISLSSETDDAVIHYTTDGSEPSYSSNIYSEPIRVTGDGTSATIKAFAAKTGMKDSYIVTSYYKIDYNFDPEKYMSNLTFGDYNLYIQGTWIGHVETPWTEPYNVLISFYNTGIYSAYSISTTRFIRSYDDYWGPAFYYGTDEDSVLKTYEIYDLYSNGKALGRIKIGWNNGGDVLGTTQGALKFIAFQSLNNMTFEFWHFDRYGPVKFILTRME